MKRSIITGLLLMAAGFAIAHAEQGLVFSVSPGMTIQSSSLGRQFNRFTPSVGIDIAFMSVNGEYTNSDWYYDYFNNNYYIGSRDDSKYSGSAVLFMPHVGLKYLLANQPASPYLAVSATKCIPVISGNSSSQNTYYNPDGSVMMTSSSSDKLDTILKKQIQNVLGFWYFTAGFGGEYRFSSAFSVIGESGFRIALASSDEEGSGSPTSSGSSSSAYRDEWKLKMAAVVGLTYAKVGLCYYFGTTASE